MYDLPILSIYLSIYICAEFLSFKVGSVAGRVWAWGSTPTTLGGSGLGFNPHNAPKHPIFCGSYHIYLNRETAKKYVLSVQTTNRGKGLRGFTYIVS